MAIIRIKRTILLLATAVFAVLLTGGATAAQGTDTTPPETTLLSSWERPNPYDWHSSATFGFISNKSGAAFECKLDEGNFEACTSPKSYFPLGESRHFFAVRAIDTAGNVDPTPAEYSWEIDRTYPVMSWTEKPGREVYSWLSVTNDTTPTWAYTFSDKNLMDGDPTCRLYNDTNQRDVLTTQPCPSPTTPPSELADGVYYFWVKQSDKAYNETEGWLYVEVDTAAPKFVKGNPTGRRVSRYTNVVVRFNDDIYGSERFVNIYKKGSRTPLAVAYRRNYGRTVEIDPKGDLKKDTWYTVKVAPGVNDGANNLKVPKTWSFKTRRCEGC